MATNTVGVIGLGYVGQPLVAAMANVGFDVIGMDIDEDVIAKLSESYQPTLYEPGLAETFERCRDRIRFTTSYEEVMSGSDTVCITVGTPVDAFSKPDYQALDTVAQNIGKYLQPGQSIVLRSTVEPGTTDRIAADLQRISGMRAGRDFYMSYSPERTIEGIALYELYNVPNIVGGINPESTRRAVSVIERLGNRVITVSSATMAELCKLVDNVYRSLNIAFANEVGTLCERARVDSYEVARAVNASYSRTSILRAGLGADGPCLSKDPLILSHYAESIGAPTPLIDSSVAVNKAATDRVTKDVLGFVRQHKLSRPRISVLGVAFKGMPETDDLRGSAAMSICSGLAGLGDGAPGQGAEFSFYDPVIRQFNGYKVETRLEQCIEGSNVVLFLSDHPSLRNIPLSHVLELADKPLLVIDCWHNLSPLDRADLPADTTYIRIGDGV